jgi:hypothetical protein
MITTPATCAAHTSRAHPVIVSTIYMVAAG